MFRIKICGITNPDDALLAFNAGADAIGLNFFPRSSRYVTFECARQIVDATPTTLLKVGLFVNEPAENVCRMSEQLGLDLLQIHGDEPPEYLGELAGRRVMRAFRVGQAGIQPAIEYLSRCDQLGCQPCMVLFDAQVAGNYGGTGQTADWDLLARQCGAATLPRIVLAGGLTAENVAEAIRKVQPRAVDVASGVECCGVRKSPEKVMAFVSAARDALESM